jgi:hypothetical protein
MVLKKVLCVKAVGKKEKKGKETPLQALTGPEGSRRLRLPDFNTLRTGNFSSIFSINL